MRYGRNSDSRKAGASGQLEMMRGSCIPRLVPYNELPESEKEYDRKTAMETLKAMIALGYSFVKLDERA